MKLFECQACGQPLYFENTQCGSCGRRLGYHPSLYEVTALEQDGKDWKALGSVASSDQGQTTAGRDLRLGCRREQGSNELALGPHVVRWCAYNLSLADHRHGLVARNRL